MKRFFSSRTEEAIGEEVEAIIHKYRTMRSERLHAGNQSNEKGTEALYTAEEKYSAYKALAGLILLGIPVVYSGYYVIFPPKPEDNYWVNLEGKLQEDATKPENISLMKQAITQKK